MEMAIQEMQEILQIGLGEMVVLAVMVEVEAIKEMHRKMDIRHQMVEEEETPEEMPDKERIAGKVEEVEGMVVDLPQEMVVMLRKVGMMAMVRVAAVAAVAETLVLEKAIITPQLVVPAAAVVVADLPETLQVDPMEIQEIMEMQIMDL
jgi:hypothetical protein